jgi:hypothetical protein
MLERMQRALEKVMERVNPLRIAVVYEEHVA